MGCNEDIRHGSKCKDWACRYLKTLQPGTVVRIVVDGRFPIQAADGNDNLALGCIDGRNCVTLTATSNKETFIVDCSKIRVIELPSP